MKKLFKFFTQIKQNQDNLCQTNVNVFEIKKKSSFFNIAFFILVFLINREFRIYRITY